MTVGSGLIVLGSRQRLPKAQCERQALRADRQRGRELRRNGEADALTQALEIGRFVLWVSVLPFTGPGTGTGTCTLYRKAHFLTVQLNKRDKELNKIKARIRLNKGRQSCPAAQGKRITATFAKAERQGPCEDEHLVICLV